ncbi:dipeptidase [Nevskia soli]|uniref:dipeptidase n=1 Tax=Nevskia soli TaxID=418856 RepID=UPI000A054777|nr:membrane dipeptidase [Nevskia soli]
MNASWTRRDFLSLSGGALLASGVAPLSGAAAGKAGNAEVYRKAFVLDCNTLASIGSFSESDIPEIKQLLRDSGVNVVKSTLGGGGGNFEATVADIAAAQGLMERHPELFIKATGIADLDRAKREGKLAVIFSFEAASMLEDKLDRIELFRGFGVRVMQLSYNRKSPFGCGCLDGDTDGVTELGKQAIAKMNALGVALDLSHANTRTTADGIALSTKPPLITHAGCRSVFAHPRNKEDREMKALADKGGVMGIYMLPFLTEDTRQPMLEDYMRHMLHALQVCGEDHVGIGTDVPFFTVSASDLEEMKRDEAERQAKGIAAPGENRPPYIPDLNMPRKLEKVSDALLAHGYGSAAVDKVLGLNFRRAFKDIWAV